MIPARSYSACGRLYSLFKEGEEAAAEAEEREKKMLLKLSRADLQEYDAKARARWSETLEEIPELEDKDEVYG